VAGGHLIAIDMQPLFQTKEYEVCFRDFVLEFYVCVCVCVRACVYTCVWCVIVWCVMRVVWV